MYQGAVSSRNPASPHPQSQPPPARRRPPPPPREGRRGDDQSRADRPLGQRRQRQEGPEDRRREPRRPARQLPERRTGSRPRRTPGSRRSSPASTRRPRSAPSPGSTPPRGRRDPRASAAPRPGRAGRCPSPPKAETSRAPNGLSPPERGAGPHQPVDQDGLVIPRLGVEGGDEPVASGAHLARAAGVSRLVAVPEAGPAVPREVQRQGQEAHQGRLPEASARGVIPFGRKGMRRRHGSLRRRTPEAVIGPSARVRSSRPRPRVLPWSVVSRRPCRCDFEEERRSISETLGDVKGTSRQAHPRHDARPSTPRTSVNS